MKLKNLVTKRYKETPSDCQIASQALMMRGGYMKSVGNGIFTLFAASPGASPPKSRPSSARRWTRIGGQEVLFPVAMPAAAVARVGPL